MRDDAFDCVTFCETVLAAALSHDMGEFETRLREIRYHNGVVELARAQSLFLRMERAQHREQALPRGCHGRRDRRSKRRSTGRAARPAALRHAGHPARRVPRQQGDAARPATSSASSAGGRISIISTSALSPSAPTATAAAPRLRKPPSRARRAHGALRRANRVHYVTLLRPRLEPPQTAVAFAQDFLSAAAALPFGCTSAV